MYNFFVLFVRLFVCLLVWQNGSMDEFIHNEIPSNQRKLPNNREKCLDWSRYDLLENVNIKLMQCVAGCFWSHSHFAGMLCFSASSASIWSIKTQSNEIKTQYWCKFQIEDYVQHLIRLYKYKRLLIRSESADVLWPFK